MSSKGKYTSASGGNSDITPIQVYPVDDDHETVGLKLDLRGAIVLAQQLINLCLDPGVEDHILVTGYRTRKRVTVLGLKTPG